MSRTLSIITICYNDAQTERTCKSVVNQTFQDFEWIVIDGGSKKETLDIFNNYKNRIDKFISEKDDGIYDAYNKGIELSKCDWLHFLNSGDWYYDNDVLKNIFENKKYNSDVLYGNINFIKSGKVNTVNLPDELRPYFFVNENIGTPSTFIKRELFKKYGNFSMEYKITGDLERWVVFEKNNAKFEHLPLIVANFDATGISSSKKYKDLHIKERKKVYETHYSKEEYQKAINSFKLKLRFFERIFSIKNSANLDYKIITIFNFHIKIKRKNK